MSIAQLSQCTFLQTFVTYRAGNSKRLFAIGDAFLRVSNLVSVGTAKVAQVDAYAMLVIQFTRDGKRLLVAFDRFFPFTQLL
jgi:hypothetical protein